MLTVLTRKLCPLMTLSLLFSCGKKITESPEDNVRDPNPQQPSQTLVVSFNSGVGEYTMKNNGELMALPEELIVNSNNATGKSATIYYEYDDSGIEISYAFRCTYKGTSASSMPVQSCYDTEGKNIDVVTSHPMYMDSKIRIEGDSSLSGKAIYSVDWK